MKVDVAARRQLVDAVLSEDKPGHGVMLYARAALSHPGLEAALASDLLFRLRSWLPILCPPAVNEAQTWAVLTICISIA